MQCEPRNEYAIGVKLLGFKQEIECFRNRRSWCHSVSSEQQPIVAATRDVVYSATRVRGRNDSFVVKRLCLKGHFSSGVERALSSAIALDVGTRPKETLGSRYGPERLISC
jgi:hypothetical protein